MIKSKSQIQNNCIICISDNYTSNDYKKSKIWKLVENDLERVSPRIVQNAVVLGDKYALSVVVRMGKQLGTALTSIANVLDISTFIIGGGVAGFGKPLFDTTKSTMKSRILLSLRNRVVVVPAKLKNEAGIKGASSLVFYKDY